MVGEYGGGGFDSRRGEAFSVPQEAVSTDTLKGDAISEKFIHNMDVEVLMSEVDRKVSPYLVLRQADVDGSCPDGGYPEVHLWVQRAFVDRENDLSTRCREFGDFLKDAKEAGLSERAGSLPEDKKALQRESDLLTRQEKEIVDVYKSLVATVEKILAMTEKTGVSHEEQCKLYQKGHSLLIRINEMYPGVLGLERRIERTVDYDSREYKKYNHEREAWRLTALNHSYIKSSRGKLNDEGFVAGLDIPGEPGTEAWYKNLPAYLSDFHGFLFMGYPDWKESKKKKNQDLVDQGATDLKYTHFEGAIVEGTGVANFTGANLEGASFRGATFRDAHSQLQGIRASGADFTGARFTRTTRMHEADLRGANFDKTHWGTYESSNEYGPYTEFNGSDLSGAHFREARLGTRRPRSEWEGAMTLGANFEYTNLEGADFSGAHLEGCEFYAARGVPRDVRRGLVPGALRGYVKYLGVENRKAEQALLRRRSTEE